MHGAGQDPYSIGRRGRDRRQSLQFKVSAPMGPEASLRLVKRIQKSISQIMRSEVGSSGHVSYSGTDAAAQRRNEPQQRSVAPGCGAWWNF